MKWLTFAVVLCSLVWLGGCGGGSSSPPPMANAGNAAPPPPGETPPPPTTPGAEGGAPPSESPPPDAGPQPGGEGQTPPSGSPDGGSATGEGTPAPPPSETPGEGSPPIGTPGGPEDGSGQPVAAQPPRIKSWREQAEEALVDGNEQEWFRLVNTNYLVNPGSWKDLEKNMAWIPALRRPAFGPRIGIAAVYVTAPKDFEGSPQPIGSSELKTAMSSLQQNASSGGGSGGGAIRRARMSKIAESAGGAPSESGGEPSSNAAGRTELAELAFHTGDFGTKLVDALKTRIESGAYGPLCKEMAEVLARGKQRPANNPEDPNNPGGTSEGTPPSEEAPRRRRWGEAGDGGSPGEGGSPEAAPRTEAGTRLGLGVFWLGKVANKEELAPLAQKAGIDVVAIYEIAIKTNRQSELINNTTKLRIVTTNSLVKKEAKEPDLFLSDGLENRVVLLAREKPGKQEDLVEKEIGHAMEALDKVCKPAALPAGVTADAVKRRLAAQIAERPADPLPLAVEIRYYAVKKILADNEAANGTMALLGPAEYAHLISTTAFDLGSDAAVGQALGRAVSVSGLIDAMGAFNAVTGNTAREEARKRAETAASKKTEPAKSGGFQGLLPFGIGGAKK